MPSATDAACVYRAGGLSVLPIRADGSKAPAVQSWQEFQKAIAPELQVKSWFSSNYGVAIVCGAVSGNLAVFDFEFPDFWINFAQLVELECPGLIGNLPQVVTPGKTGAPGHHLYCRTEKPIATGKLAKITPEEAVKRTGDKGKTTAIEIKGEGGYVLAPGSPAACHESGRTYQHVAGPFLEETPVITDEQVSALISCAKALDQSTPTITESYVGAPRGPVVGDEDRPGTIFNRRASWPDVLNPHGWALVKANGQVSYWRRPGKKKGISATTGFCSSVQAGDLLCVFSSNAAPLAIPAGKDRQCFSKFAAFSLLNHNGDFSKAAKELGSRYTIDLGASAADSEAQWIGAAMTKQQLKGMTVEQVIEAIAGQLKQLNVEKKWELASEEVQKIAQRAAMHRIEQEPTKVTDLIRKEIDESAGSATPAWQLVIIESEPPTYRLKSPYWSGRAKVSGAGGFIFLAGRELRTWGGIFDAAMAQAEVAIPEKIHGWRGLLQKLLDQATREKALLEQKRPLVVAEFLLRCLDKCPDARGEGEAMYRGEYTRKLPDGMTICKMSVLLAMGKQELDGPTRNELAKVMTEMGFKAVVFGGENNRSRWWGADQEAVKNLQSLTST